MVSTVLWVFITNLPCHVVTLKISIRFILAVFKYKTDADIKEVIRLGICPIFTFTTYYEPSSPSLDVVDNSTGMDIIQHSR